MKTKDLVRIALFMALTTVATMFISINLPSTGGYFNLGDSIILIGSALLGPIPGFLIGGVGSALADILGGYSSFAFITLIAKGLEGFVVGYLVHKNVKGLLAFIVGGVIMVTGYFLGEIVILGFEPAVALAEVYPNGLQAVFSIIISILLLPQIKKIVTK